jgi:predicted dehydrogenase
VTSRPLRCIVVGLGAISRSMDRVLAEKPWYETVAVVDADEQALAGAHTKHPEAAPFTDLASALEHTSADAVLVNTPSELHYEQTRAALRAGRHVLVAKPITNDFEQAQDLVELATHHDVTLSVGQQMRYMKHYRAVARFLEEGRLGSVELINFVNPKPRPNPANLSTMAQPALYELSCHHFDSLLSLVPDRVPLEIGCDGFTPSWAAYAGPSMVNAWIRFSGGLHVLYQCGFSSQAVSYELRLEGSEGVLRCRGVHMSSDEMANELAPPLGDFAPCDMADDLPVVDPWDPFVDLWHAYVTGGPEPPFSGANNLKAFALLSAGIESVERGGSPVAVATDPRYARAFRTSTHV